ESPTPLHIEQPKYYPPTISYNDRLASDVVRDHLAGCFLEQLVVVRDDEAPVAQIRHGYILSVLAFQSAHQVAARHESHQPLVLVYDGPLVALRHDRVFVRQSLKQAVDGQ